MTTGMTLLSLAGGHFHKLSAQFVTKGESTYFSRKEGAEFYQDVHSNAQVCGCLNVKLQLPEYLRIGAHHQLPICK